MGFRLTSVVILVINNIRYIKEWDYRPLGYKNMRVTGLLGLLVSRFEKLVRLLQDCADGLLADDFSRKQLCSGRLVSRYLGSYY